MVISDIVLVSKRVACWQYYALWSWSGNSRVTSRGSWVQSYHHTKVERLACFHCSNNSNLPTMSLSVEFSQTSRNLKRGSRYVWLPPWCAWAFTLPTDSPLAELRSPDPLFNFKWTGGEVFVHWKFGIYTWACSIITWENNTISQNSLEGT